jgi:hypothetical protein
MIFLLPVWFHLQKMEDTHILANEDAKCKENIVHSVYLFEKNAMRNNLSFIFEEIPVSCSCETKE